MTKSITLYTPSGDITYTEGVADVTQINVRFSFANVVDIRIYFTDLTVIRYLQVAAVYTVTP